MSWLAKLIADDDVLELKLRANLFIADVTRTRPHVLVNSLPLAVVGSVISVPKPWESLHELAT